MLERRGPRGEIQSEGFLLLQGELPSSSWARELPGPLESRTREQQSLLWLAPGEWLLIVPATDVLSMEARLSTELRTTFAAVTDLSDAFASFELTGKRGAEVLMTGCSLDLHTEAFGSGRVARTVLAGVAAIVWRAQMERFRVFVDRSFAEHLEQWLARNPGS